MQCDVINTGSLQIQQNLIATGFTISLITMCKAQDDIVESKISILVKHVCVLYNPKGTFIVWVSVLFHSIENSVKKTKWCPTLLAFHELD